MRVAVLLAPAAHARTRNWQSISDQHIATSRLQGEGYAYGRGCALLAFAPARVGCDG